MGIHYIDPEHSLGYYKDHFKAFILAEASYDCDPCIEAEDMLDKVWKLFAMEEIQYKKKDVPIVRKEVEGLEYPRISLIFKNKQYEYKKGYHLDLFIHFLNRHLYPIVKLTTREQIEDFRNVSQEWTENTPLYNGKYRKLGSVFEDYEKVTRVIAFVSDAEEYKFELKEILTAAKTLGFRDDLRIAKVVNPDLVQEYKQEMGTQWFDEDSTNSMVVFCSSKDEDKPVNYYDLNANIEYLDYWINSASLEHVEKMSVFSVQIMESMNIPMFVAFLDLNGTDATPKSQEMLDILNKVTLDYPQFLFGYFDNHSYDPKKKYLGIENENLPQFALFNPPEEITLVYPEDKEISHDNLRLFLDNGIDAAMKGEPVFKGKSLSHHF